MHWLFLWDISVNLPENLSPAPAGAEYILPDFPLAIQEKYDIVFSCAETAHRSASDFLSDSAGTGILPHDCAADPAKKGVLLCLRSC